MYASDGNLYRSSPFFWAFRDAARASGIDDVRALNPLGLGGGGWSDAVFAVTDALPFYEVGDADHVIEAAESAAGGTLRSEVEIRLKIFEGALSLPPSRSTMTTTSTFRAASDTTLELTVDKTEVKESSLAQIPGFAALDTFAFPSRQLFDTVAPSAGGVNLELIYLTPSLRISRELVNDVLFVHTKV